MELSFSAAKWRNKNNEKVIYTSTMFILCIFQFLQGPLKWSCVARVPKVVMHGWLSIVNAIRRMDSYL